MKTNLLIGLCVAALLPGCVQKTYQKTVVYILHVETMKPAMTVAVRGNDKPLNWQSDYNMSLVLPDSTYRTAVTYRTGYRFTEVKFVADGVFELPDQPNRRVLFSDTDTTFYEATFDALNQIKPTSTAAQ